MALIEKSFPGQEHQKFSLYATAGRKETKGLDGGFKEKRPRLQVFTFVSRSQERYATRRHRLFLQILCSL